MASQIQVRRGTALEWTNANPVLAQGEPGYEVDTGNLKFGDGSTAWASLPYRAGPAVGGGGGSSTFASITGKPTTLAGYGITDAAASSHTHAYGTITGTPTLGTAAALNVPATGDAGASEVVKGSDTRLTNSRAPTAHSHSGLLPAGGTAGQVPKKNSGTDFDYSWADAASPVTTVSVVNCVANDPAAADANTALIQAALDAAGQLTGPTEVRVNAPGSCYISRTLEVWSYTKFSTNTGTYLKRITTRATNFCMVHNRGAQLRYRTPGATITGGFITVSAAGHPFNEGAAVYVNNWKGNASLNGFKTLVNVVPGVSFQYAASGSNPTNAAVELVDVVRSTTVAGTTFTRASNVVTVAEPSHTRQPGDRVWVAGIPIGANSFNGAILITTVVPGVSWSYANAGADEAGTGTALLLGDRAIEFDLSLDGSSESYSYVGAPANGCDWGNVSPLIGKIQEARSTGNGGRACNFFNIGLAHLPYGKAAKNCSVLFQFDSFCENVEVGRAHMQGADDDAVAWGVTDVGLYTETIPPCGPGNMGILNVGSISGESSTGLLKMYCAAGFDLGSVFVGRISGTGLISIGDASPGVGGGTFKTLKMDYIDNVPGIAASHAVFLGGNGSFSSMGAIEIGTFVDQHVLGISTPGSEGILLRGAPTSVSIGHIIGRIARINAIMTSLIDVGVTCHIKVDRVTSQSSVFDCGLGPIESLIVGEWSHNQAAGPITNLVTGGTGGGYYRNIQIGQLKVKNATRILYNGFNGAVQTMSIGDLEADGVGTLCGPDGSGTYNLYVQRGRMTNVGNNVLQFYTSSTNVYFRGEIEHPDGQAMLAVDGPVYRIDSRTMKFTAPDGTTVTQPTLAPAAGDLIYNTNAAFGTGVGLYGRTAASSWQKLF